MGVEFLGIPSQLRKKFNIEKQTLALLRWFQRDVEKSGHGIFRGTYCLGIVLGASVYRNKQPKNLSIFYYPVVACCGMYAFRTLLLSCVYFVTPFNLFIHPCRIIYLVFLFHSFTISFISNSLVIFFLSPSFLPSFSPRRQN
jgi:hypothetical protein